MDNCGGGQSRYGIGFVARLTILDANSETGLALFLEGFEISSPALSFHLSELSERGNSSAL
jgi:hypothetical protein